MSKELRGALNLSKFYTKPNQPRFYGKALINGVEYEIKGWEKVKDDGEPWISLCFESIGEVPEAVKSKQLFSTPVRAPVVRDYDFDDDIPF